MLKNDSVLVALGIIAFLTLVSVAAILRYPSVEVIKIFAELDMVFSLLTGVFVAYFFTSDTIKKQQKKLQVMASKNNELIKLSNEVLYCNAQQFEEKKSLLKNHLDRCLHESATDL